MWASQNRYFCFFCKHTHTNKVVFHPCFSISLHPLLCPLISPEQWSMASLYYWLIVSWSFKRSVLWRCIPNVPSVLTAGNRAGLCLYHPHRLLHKFILSVFDRLQVAALYLLNNKQPRERKSDLFHNRCKLQITVTWNIILHLIWNVHG